MLIPNISGDGAPSAKGEATKLPLVCKLLNAGDEYGNADGGELYGKGELYGIELGDGSMSKEGAPSAYGEATKLPLVANIEPPLGPPMPASDELPILAYEALPAGGDKGYALASGEAPR